MCILGLKGLTLMFSGLCENICLKESEVWRKVVSNKITATLVTQGLLASFLSLTYSNKRYQQELLHEKTKLFKHTKKATNNTKLASFKRHGHHHR